MKIVLLDTHPDREDAVRWEPRLRAALPAAEILHSTERLRLSDAAVVVLFHRPGAPFEHGPFHEATRAWRDDFPVLLAVPDVGTYQPSQLPLEFLTLREVKAVGLQPPDALIDALRHHLGERDMTSDVAVFISYSWSDGKGWADALHDGLWAREVPAFQDARDLPPGVAVQNAIEREIGRRRVLLVVDTPRARQSAWIREEIVLARASRVPVVVVGKDDHLQIEEVVDAVYRQCDAIDEATLSWVEKAVRRQRARVALFGVRAMRTVGGTSRKLGVTVLERGDGHLRLRAGTRSVRVEASHRFPDGVDLTQLADRARGSEVDLGLLIAGSSAWPAPIRQVVEAMRRGQQQPMVAACPLPGVAAELARGLARGPMPAVQLSASLPEPEHVRDLEAAKHALHDFVVAFASALLLGGGHLVFGGHPTVTPVVHKAVKQLRSEGYEGGQVTLFQLRRFRRTAPVEVDDAPVFGPPRWIGRELEELSSVTEGIAEDLGTMRDAMSQEATVAVFLGGKHAGLGGPGLLDEYRRFRAVHPDAPVHLVGLLDGYTRELIKDLRDTDPNVIVHQDRDVDLVVGMILADIIRRTTS
jgi:hypothetical protein